MPKISAGISKDKRIRTLLDVLGRWGRLNKKHIDQYVSRALDIDSEVLFRNLYRDLDVLVAEGTVVQHRFTRDGQPLLDYDPDIHKNTLLEWSLALSEAAVVGETQLRNQGGALVVPEILKQEIRIEEGTSSTSFNSFHLFFRLGTAFMCLKINLDLAPIKVVIGRAQKTGLTKQAVEALNKNLGPRWLMLQVPNSKLSKEHVILTIKGKGQNFELLDQNSKNGTHWAKLTQAEFDELHKTGRLDLEKTYSRSWSDLASVETLEFIEAVGDKTFAPKTPCLVILGKDFRFAVI